MRLVTIWMSEMEQDETGRQYYALAAEFIEYEHQRCRNVVQAVLESMRDQNDPLIHLNDRLQAGFTATNDPAYLSILTPKRGTLGEDKMLQTLQQARNYREAITKLNTASRQQWIALDAGAMTDWRRLSSWPSLGAQHRRDAHGTLIRTNLLRLAVGARSNDKGELGDPLDTIGRWKRDPVFPWAAAEAREGARAPLLGEQPARHARNIWFGMMQRAADATETGWAVTYPRYAPLRETLARMLALRIVPARVVSIQQDDWTEEATQILRALREGLPVLAPTDEAQGDALRALLEHLQDIQWMGSAAPDTRTDAYRAARYLGNAHESKYSKRGTALVPLSVVGGPAAAHHGRLPWSKDTQRTRFLRQPYDSGQAVGRLTASGKRVSSVNMRWRDDKNGFLLPSKWFLDDSNERGVPFSRRPHPFRAQGVQSLLTSVPRAFATASQCRLTELYTVLRDEDTPLAVAWPVLLDATVVHALRRYLLTDVLSPLPLLDRFYAQQLAQSQQLGGAELDAWSLAENVAALYALSVVVGNAWHHHRLAPLQADAFALAVALHVPGAPASPLDILQRRYTAWRGQPGVDYCVGLTDFDYGLASVREEKALRRLEPATAYASVFVPFDAAHTSEAVDRAARYIDTHVTPLDDVPDVRSAWPQAMAQDVARGVGALRHMLAETLLDSVPAEVPLRAVVPSAEALLRAVRWADYDREAVAGTRTLEQVIYRDEARAVEPEEAFPIDVPDQPLYEPLTPLQYIGQEEAALRDADAMDLDGENLLLSRSFDFQLTFGTPDMPQSPASPAASQPNEPLRTAQETADFTWDPFAEHSLFDSPLPREQELQESEQERRWLLDMDSDLDAWQGRDTSERRRSRSVTRDDGDDLAPPEKRPRLRQAIPAWA